MTVDLVFVYGSLKRGCYNHGLLEYAEFVGAGQTEPRYRLLDLGPYPAMIEHDAAPLAIGGELYRIDAATLARLDRLEDVGVEYRRVVIPVSMVDGPGCDQRPTTQEAWTYLWMRSTAGLRLWPDAVWREKKD